MNHRPVVDTTDDAILRRLLIIPFKNKVDDLDARQNQNYAQQLIAEEGPGILNRLLQGLREWNTEGLRKDNLPLAIAHETGEYRLQKHIIENFFSRTTTDASLWERAGYLYAAYKLWAKEVNVHPMDGKSFSEELKRRSFDRKRGDNSAEKGSGFIWYGLRLLEEYRQQAIAAQVEEEDT